MEWLQGSPARFAAVRFAAGIGGKTIGVIRDAEWIGLELPASAWICGSNG